jgi:trigger factor
VQVKDASHNMTKRNPTNSKSNIYPQKLFGGLLIKSIHLHSLKLSKQVYYRACTQLILFGGVAKLVDALDLGSNVLDMGVRVPPPSHKSSQMWAFFKIIKKELIPIIMANVTQENIGKNHERIIVHLKKEDYLPAVDKALKLHSKNAQIPGFRKGMVPVGVVRKMYGASVFSDEILRTAGKNLEDYLNVNKFEIYGRPIPSENQKAYNFNINQPEDYTFEFEVGTRPDFEIPLLNDSATIPFYKITVSDEMLQEEVEKLQYKAGDMKDPETITIEDNVINVTFEECEADGTIVEGGIKKDNSLLVKYFTPQLQTQLMDKQAGDSIIFNLRASFDEKLLPAIIKDLGLNPADEASKEKNFKLNIVKVGLVERAPLTVETFEKIYPGRAIETEEQFREVLKGEVEQYWMGQSRVQLHNELFEKLVHETPIEVPVNFMKRWMSVGGENYVSPEQVEKQYASFDHQMRWELISNKIAKNYSIDVTNEDLDTAARMQIMSYFGQYGETPSMDAEWIEPFVKKQLADKKFKDELFNKIMTDKLFWAIEQKVNLQETEISLEDFIKVPASHHHHH